MERERLEQIRAEIRATMAQVGRRQFPAELRDEVAAYAREQNAQGHSLKSIAEALGMNEWTLSRWHWRVGRAERGEKAVLRPAFVEVTGLRNTVGAAVKASAFEVVGPSGYAVRVKWPCDGAALRGLLSALEGR